MDIMVNGEPMRVEGPLSVADLVAQMGQRAEIVAVELNGAIVSREAFGQTAVHDRDAVEVVCFMGGG